MEFVLQTPPNGPNSLQPAVFLEKNTHSLCQHNTHTWTCHVKWHTARTNPSAAARLSSARTECGNNCRIIAWYWFDIRLPVISNQTEIGMCRHTLGGFGNMPRPWENPHCKVHKNFYIYTRWRGCFRWPNRCVERCRNWCFITMNWDGWIISLVTKPQLICKCVHAFWFPHSCTFTHDLGT